MVAERSDMYFSCSLSLCSFNLIFNSFVALFKSALILGSLVVCHILLSLLFSWIWDLMSWDNPWLDCDCIDVIEAITVSSLSNFVKFSTATSISNFDFRLILTLTLLSRSFKRMNLDFLFLEFYLRRWKKQMSKGLANGLNLSLQNSKL